MIGNKTRDTVGSTFHGLPKQVIAQVQFEIHGLMEYSCDFQYILINAEEDNMAANRSALTVRM